MPGAPASRQTSTACVTLGVLPPRELRSVAILLTLTERRIIRIRRHYSGFRLQAPGSRLQAPGSRLQASVEHSARDLLDLLVPVAWCLSPCVATPTSASLPRRFLRPMPERSPDPRLQS